MARYPALGEMKTRLTRQIGAQRTYDLYRALLHDIGRRFAARRRPLVWAFHPPERNFADVVEPGARCLPQSGTDLGDRMRTCFRTLCAEGFERVIMIGADVPHVLDEWLDEAEQKLDDADVVLGPAADGGYYLIAMRRAHDVFSGIEMGTARVLQATRVKAAAIGLRVHLLPASFDIDEEADVARLRALLDASENRDFLPATAAVLAAWR